MRCSSSPTIVLICGQIQQWEQNLERFNMDLFRMRCYLASLQGSELPNPKSLLATASRPTKAALARLGIFSVSSFHALVSSLEHYSYSPLFFLCFQKFFLINFLHEDLKDESQLCKLCFEAMPLEDKGTQVVNYNTKHLTTHPMKHCKLFRI